MKNLSNIAIIILQFSIVFFWVTGSIHSCNKHKDEGNIVRYSPFALYRGAEMFWHEDYAGVDWNEKINDDINTSIRLLTAITLTYDILNTKEQISKFSEQLSKYPSDKRKQIANAVRRFLNFGNLWTRDLVSFLDKNESNSAFDFSSKTKVEYDSLKNFYHIEEVSEWESIIDSLIIEIKMYPENRQLYLNRLKGHDIKDNKIYSNYFYKLFNENF